MSADFTPDFKDYNVLKPFRFWCQKVLPLTYDDSLSYYEVLCKVKDYLNNTIKDVGNLEDNVQSMHDAFVALQAWVNDYFDNLDLTEELTPIVRDELDAVLENVTYDPNTKTAVLVEGEGTLSSDLVEKLQIRDKTYPVADASARADIEKLSVFVTPEMYGAVGDGVADDTTAIQNAIDSGLPVVFTNSYLISESINLYNAADSSARKVSVDFGDCPITYTGSDFAFIIGSNVSGDNNNRELQIITRLNLRCPNGSGILVTDYASYVRIDRCVIRARNIGIQIGNTTSALSLNTVITNCTIENAPRMTENSVGILCNKLDNTVHNTLIYFFKHQIEASANGGGLYLNLVHSLGASPFDSVFFYDNSVGVNYILNCYCDTDKTFIGGTSTSGHNVVENFFYYSYSTSLSQQILFDTVKAHRINGGVVAHNNMASLIGITRNILNFKQYINSWDIKNVIFTGNYSTLSDATDMLFTTDEPCYYWDNAFTSEKILRIGYLTGNTNGTSARLSICHGGANVNGTNNAFEVALYFRRDTCEYRVLGGTIPTGTKLYFKKVLTGAHCDCWEVAIKFASVTFAPTAKLSSFGTKIFTCAINNPSKITDYPYITDTTGYTQITAG